MSPLRSLYWSRSVPLATIDSGPITNHVNFVRTARGQFAYVTIGGLNQVKAFRTDTFEQIAAINVGALPHGIWPSGDGTRLYVGTENGDEITAIDSSTNKIIAKIPNGQAAQALVYVPAAVPVDNDAPLNLEPPGLASQATHLTLGSVGKSTTTTVSLFDQGITQVLQAAVTGLEPMKQHILALASQPDGSGQLEPLAHFTTNQAGAQIVNAVGPIRQIVTPSSPNQERRYLVIAIGDGGTARRVVQVQR